MNKTIIALKGRKWSGKSKTLCKLFSLLLEQSSATLIFESPKGDCEVLGVICIDGINIGIASAGDYAVEVDKNITILIEKSCSIIVCASRTKGGPKAAVLKYSDQFNIEWRQQTYATSEDEQQVIVDRSATEIFQRVLQIIKEQH